MAGRAAPRLASNGTPYAIPGTYVLWLRAADATRIRVGRLGSLRFCRGYYGYVGSAFGPGGLDARLRHHLGGTIRPRWHIDYLKSRLPVTAIWLAGVMRKNECVWSGILGDLAGDEAQVDGFGASDCACRSHLFRFRRLPDAAEFNVLLQRRQADHPPVEYLQPPG